MKTLSETRRENLRALVDKRGGSTKVAALLGYRNGSFLSQQIGPNPTREITERSARRYEADLGLPPGTLDLDGAAAPAPADPVAGVSVDTVAAVIRLLGTVLAAEGASLPPQRFADVAAMAVTDAAEHGGQAREGHIRALVKLVR